MTTIPVSPISIEGPVPLVRETAEGVEYPTAALGPLKGAVLEVQKMTQAPVELPAQSALAVASLAVQGFVDVETLGGDRVTSLFMMTIAQSGERKSTCDELLMQPIVDFEAECFKRYAAELGEYKFVREQWEEHETELLDKAKSDPTAEKRIKSDLAALGPAPKKPRSPERIVTEPTFEGLTKLLDVGQPSLGLFSDEGGQFLGGFALSRDQFQKTVTGLNGLWQGKTIRRTRAGDGHLTLAGRRIAMHLMVQPEMAQGFLSNPIAVDSGITARMLVCKPDSTIGRRFHKPGKPKRAALDKFHDRLKEILSRALPMDHETGQLEPRLLPLSASAKKQLVKFADEIEREQDKGGRYEEVTGIASKSAEQAARIAGVLTAFSDLDAETVSVARMRNGMQLARYYLDEAVRLARSGSSDETMRLAEKLRCWLTQKWTDDVVVPSEIVQLGPTEFRDTKTLKPYLNILVEHGWLMPMANVEVRGKLRKIAYRIVREASAGCASGV